MTYLAHQIVQLTFFGFHKTSVSSNISSVSNVSHRQPCSCIYLAYI